jgi:class 3 adenylate cyclase
MHQTSPGISASRYCHGLDRSHPWRTRSARRFADCLVLARAAVSRGPGTSRQRVLTEPPLTMSLAQQRTIVAVDIESSTARTNPVKAELRTRLYERFDAALRSAGINERHRDRFVDRGDGALALIHPVEQAFKVPLLNRAIPALNQLLADYNASLPPLSRPERQLRIRVVVHAGDVHYDVNGCFGEALDVAFRLLDAAPVKKALRGTASPLVLVISEDIYKSVVRQRYDGIDQGSFRALVHVQIAGERYAGWIHSPEEAAHGGMAEIVDLSAARMRQNQ